MRALVLVFPLFLMLAAPAFASDGVLEINQACAVQTGCFAGDAAGFPVTISQPSSSYRLTSALSVPDEFTTGIVVSAGASDVTLDLGGFAISGGNQCSAPPVSCTLNGTGFGVQIQSDRVSVMNGKLAGLGSVGIYGQFGDGHEIRNVTFARNRYQGIRIDGAAATVEDVTALRNGAEGILLGPVARVVQSTVNENGGDGIATGVGATFSGNNVSGNGGRGILVDLGSVVERKSARLNVSDGIVARDGSNVEGNAVSRNGGFGLCLFPFSAYHENTIWDIRWGRSRRLA